MVALLWIGSYFFTFYTCKLTLPATLIPMQATGANLRLGTSDFTALKFAIEKGFDKLERVRLYMVK